jgi:hypothetical protein
VAKAAEAALFDDKDPAKFIANHEDGFDFCLFRKGKIALGDGTPLPKHLRYYVSTNGERLVSMYDSLDGSDEERVRGVHAEGQAECLGDRKNYHCSSCGEKFTTKAQFNEHNGIAHAWKITPAMDFDGRVPDNIDYRYYLDETRKLMLTM